MCHHFSLHPPVIVKGSPVGVPAGPVLGSRDESDVDADNGQEIPEGNLSEKQGTEDIITLQILQITVGCCVNLSD